MPTIWHQELAQLLFIELREFVLARQLGKVHFIGLRVRISSKTIREPDIVFLRKENMHLQTPRLWHGADLAMEVVSESPQDRQRDYVDKLADYAAVGIGEYWVVDYQERVVMVYQLIDGQYQVHGEFREGQQATAAYLEGFSVDVAALFTVADETRREVQG